jgi:hypothetical protein
MNYTWSHSLDNLSSTFTDSLGGQGSGYYGLGFVDSFNPRLNYGNSDFDIRHRFVATETWETPWLKNSRNWAARNVLGGWSIGSVLNIRSGAPFSIYDCTNGVVGCPLYVPGGPIATSGSAVVTSGADTFNYITLPNTGGKLPSVLNFGDSLQIPVCTGLLHQGCTYTLSGLPYPERNQFYGPGYWNVDMNLLKNVQLNERFKLQFRAEMYDIFNHVNQYVNYLNLDAYGMNAGNSPYVQTEKGGQYGYAGQSTDEHRRVEFGLRLSF